MSRRRITVTVDEDVARYLDQAPNRSARVCDAVREYRARRQERELAAAYAEDREDSERIAAEWVGTDAPVLEGDPGDAQ